MSKKMTRREFVRSAGLAVAALGTPGVLGAGARAALGLPGVLGAGEGKKPNVLFVLSDQWRYSALGTSRNRDESVKTPHLDAIAKQGVVFHRCFSAHPLCTPNRSAIITGRFPHQTGMIENNLMLPPEEVCIGDVFSKAGYTTHYIGKWHMDGAAKPGFVPPGWRRRGFKTFEGFNRGHEYYRSPTFTDGGEKMKSRVRYEPQLQADLAIEFMKKNREKPFFCYVSWGPPHTPYKPPKRYKDVYKPADVKLRPNVAAAHKKKARADLANYFGLCTSLDDQFGRLMKALQDLGLAANTLVVFTADHGDLHYSHGKQYKNQPEDESLHVPLIMRMPGAIKAGQQVETLVSSVDLMPTVLSLCGLPVPRSCSGTDKSAAAREGKDPGNISVYAERGPQWRAVIKGGHKLIVRSGGKPAQLYDLEKDPYEMKNLLDDPARKKILNEMVAEYEAWKKRTGDPFPKAPERARKRYTKK
jgi:arylsulfatase A-like enzyme